MTWVARLLVAGGALGGVVGGSAFGAFSITTPGGTWSSTLVGQNFSPSVEGTPAPGLGATDVVQLTSFGFTKSGNGTGNVATRLVVLPGAYFDTNGDPNGSFVVTADNALGISTNAIDTASAGAGTALTFTFDNLPLVYGDNYTVAFATVGAGNALSFFAPGVLYVDYVDNGSGVFVPSANYGGTGNYNASALYADFNGDGYFEADNNAADAAFTATFEVASVPEPGVVGVMGLGGALALARRRR